MVVPWNAGSNNIWFVGEKEMKRGLPGFKLSGTAGLVRLVGEVEGFHSFWLACNK